MVKLAHREVEANEGSQHSKYNCRLTLTKECIPKTFIHSIIIVHSIQIVVFLKWHSQKIT